MTKVSFKVNKGNTFGDFGYCPFNGGCPLNTGFTVIKQLPLTLIKVAGNFVGSFGWGRNL